jgi:hypothetical protein
MSEPARSHPAIPLSPPSPPAEGVKEGSKSHFSDYTPYSPASPFMSVATKSYGQSFAETQTTSISAAAQQSPSPPTSAPMSTQVSQQPTMTANTSFPTPDNSVIGQTRKVPDEFDEEHISKRQRIHQDVTAAQEQSSGELDFYPITSHHRDAESQASDPMLGVTDNLFPESFNSPKPANDTTQPAAVEMSLEQLQKNVGQVFYLCKSGKNFLAVLAIALCRAMNLMLTCAN